MYQRGLPEAHLCFRRVNVYIDLCRRHFKKEQKDGEGGRRHDIAVRVRNRMKDEPVANKTVIDEDVNGVAIELLQLRLGGKA